MIASEHFGQPRTAVWQDALYMVRDVREAAAPKAKLIRCEYAVLAGDEVEWTPCIEGVMFADIKPFVRIDANG
jgi:hypothetical protein